MVFPRIAVVDDDPDLLQLVDEIFLERGWNLLPFVDGGDFLEFIEHELPDAVVLDLHLGTIESGWDVLGMLRSDARTQNVPVIIWSADLHHLGNREFWLMEQGIGILPKPFDLRAFYTSIETALASRVAVAPIEE